MSQRQVRKTMGSRQKDNRFQVSKGSSPSSLAMSHYREFCCAAGRPKKKHRWASGVSENQTHPPKSDPGIQENVAPQGNWMKL